MARRMVRLGPGECSNVETGARYFAALAFPGPQEDEEREEAARAKAGLYLHEANRVDQSDEPFEDQHLNELVALDPAWCRARVRTMDRRLEDRGKAARAVRPWIMEAFGAEVPQAPGIKKFTQRQIALYLCGGDALKADNFQKRIWRPCRPVLHLAVAQDLGLSLLGKAESTELNLANVGATEAMVELAGRLTPRLCLDPRFGVSEAELLKLEWVG